MSRYLLNEKKGELFFAEQESVVPHSGPLVLSTQEKEQKRTRLVEIANRKKELMAELNQLKREEIDIKYNRQEKTTELHGSKATFRCPVSDCNGIVTRGSCVACNKQSCVHCHEVKEQDHECNKDTLKTIEELKKTTKPCPSCATPIQKAIGCDQMWCTNCRTFFSWTMLTIIDARSAHNPHYHEYMRANPEARVRELGDMPCGGYNFIFRYKSEKHREACRIVYEIGDSRLYGGLMQKYHPTPISFDDLRVQFIMNKLDKKTFISKMNHSQKMNDFKTEIYHILSLFRDVTIEIHNSNDDWEYKMVRLREISEYCLEQVKKVLDVYTSKDTQIVKRFDSLLKVL